VPFLALVHSKSSSNHFPFRLVQDRLFHRNSFSLKIEKRVSLARNPISPGQYLSFFKVTILSG